MRVELHTLVIPVRIQVSYLSIWINSKSIVLDSYTLKPVPKSVPSAPRTIRSTQRSAECRNDTAATFLQSYTILWTGNSCLCHFQRSLQNCNKNTSFAAERGKIISSSCWDFEILWVEQKNFLNAKNVGNSHRGLW